jgi:hypothetical protein
MKMPTLTHVEKAGPWNDPRNFDLSKWDQVESTWWYRKSGEVEIRLSSDPGLNWEVSQMKSGEALSTPLYTPNFDDALAEATRIFAFHERARASQVPRY